MLNNANDSKIDYLHDEANNTFSDYTFYLLIILPSTSDSIKLSSRKTKHKMLSVHLMEYLK